MSGRPPGDPTRQLGEALIDRGDAGAALEAIGRGADLAAVEDLTGERVSPLTWAVGEGLGPEGSLRVVRALLAGGLGVAGERPEDGATSVHRAAQLGYDEVLAALLAADGRVALTAYDYLSRSPLIFAVQAGHLAAAQLLLDAGADPDGHDAARVGHPPLRWAVGERNEEMVRLLLRAGADPGLGGPLQGSALDQAAAWKHSRHPRLRGIYQALEAVARDPRRGAR